MTDKTITNEPLEAGQWRIIKPTKSCHWHVSKVAKVCGGGDGFVFYIEGILNALPAGQCYLVGPIIQPTTD